MMQIADRCPVHRTLEAGSRVFTSPADQPPMVAEAENPVQHAVDAQSVDGQA
jgi:hypothetical protein